MIMIIRNSSDQDTIHAHAVLKQVKWSLETIAHVKQKYVLCVLFLTSQLHIHIGSNKINDIADNKIVTLSTLRTHCNY